MDQELDRFVVGQREVLVELGPALTPLVDQARIFVSGGKKLRPEFCYVGWLVAGGDPEDPRILTAAASLEWLQGSALVHDDLMDGSDTRRGRPSVHRAAEAEHRSQSLSGEPERFGLATAILLGDLMLSWADEQFRSSGLPRTTKAIHFLDRCKTEVVAGQYLDVLGQTRETLTVEEAMRVIRFKTAKYTVERPLHLGAALAGADAELIAALSAVALPTGEAFQLRDDVLGVFGDPEITGKPAGDDIREGKRTVLVARTLDALDPEQRREVLRLLGTSEDVELVAELMRSSGALASVEKQIAELESEAAAAIQALGPRGQDALGALLLRTTRRSS